ncbi:hypothetical protein ACG7TL_004415 [Trametes sanguinea]
MPGVSRTQRAEAKYNVTLEYPHLGLHSAASSGNLGLVTYALDHGQPVNSVLDGVLPLHVASSGGNELIVRLLIERGADVNAPRLPRKYSSDRHRDASAPIVGTSGATPLHFAAANGHEHVVRTLLLHGAHPDRADKHGVTPEMLARQNGWTRCADLLSQWTHMKDKDLRERELPSTVPGLELESASRVDSIECKLTEKKLKVKRSIDNALHMLRPTLPTPPSSGYLPSDSSYTTSPPPITESASVDSSPDATLLQESYPRRPSLPHIFDPAPYSQSQNQGQSTSTHLHLHQHYHSKSSGRPSFSSSRRPRSAGTDAEPSASTSSSAYASSGRLRGKISLLHMFKKSSTTGDSSASTPGLPATPDSRDSLSGYASSSSALTSASASPAPEQEREHRYHRSRSGSGASPLRTRASESGLMSASSASASSSPSAYLTTIPSSRSRLASESAVSTSTASAVAFEATSSAMFPPLAVELHRKLSAERLRARSGSGSSSSGTTEARASPSAQHSQGHRSPLIRPGILRSHHRSTSGTQSQPSQTSAQSLRFDSTASVPSVAARRSRSGLNVKVSNSASSLRGEGRDSPRSPRHAASSSSYQRQRETPASKVTHTVAEDDDEDEDDDGYGEVISPRLGLGLALAPGEGKSRIGDLRTDERRRRRPSAGSYISHESSPLPSPTAPAAEAAGGAGLGFDCPFSINRPPPQPLPTDAARSSSQSSDVQAAPSAVDQQARQGAHGDLLTTHHVDNRGRGDSIGSMSTSTDASASAPQTPLPLPGATSSIGLGLQIRSPEMLPIDLPPSVDLHTPDGFTDPADAEARKDRNRADLSVSAPSDSDNSAYAQSLARATSPRLRAPPLDIDIRAISSHAQAEALVQRAQKSILEMEDVDIELPGLDLGLLSSASSGGLGVGLGSGANGRTPLSAKLAAYGETLAIERRFKEQEQERERQQDVDEQTPFGSPTTPSGRSADDRLRSRHSEKALRKFSLEERRPSDPRPARRTRTRRPHTADGETQDASPGFLSSPSPGHKPSLSSSALYTSRSSSSTDDNHNTTHTAPSSARTLPVISSPTPTPLSPPRIVRSRTPDPGSRYLAPSPPLQPQHLSASTSPTFGVPLSRVSTAPPRHASPDIVPQRSMSEQERQVARANKLMKMGLAAPYESFSPRAHSPYGHARNGGGGSGGSTSAGLGFGGAAGAAKQKLGGFRGLVQTLKGKS